MDNWTKLQLTELESVEDPGHGCTPLGLVHGDVEEVGGDGDQEDQHPHNHLQCRSYIKPHPKGIHNNNNVDFALLGTLP